jgi:diacylglycerol kinase family enzyme
MKVGEEGERRDAGRAREILLFANPSAGRGRAGRWVEEARRRLERDGVRVTVALRRDEPGAFFAAAPGRFGEAWLFGGDGTLNELACQLPAPHSGIAPTLALFPAGTGNVVARELGVPLSFEGAWRVAREGAARAIDLLRVNGRRAAFMASAGLDAELARRVAERRRGPMKRTDWIRAALASRSFAREAPLEVAADGRELGVVRYAAAFNCSRYAGGFVVCPSARIDDGRLELLLLREPIRPRWLRVTWAALRHRPHELPDATLVAARRIELRGVACSQVDGDPGPAGALTIEIEPAALRVRAPA